MFWFASTCSGLQDEARPGFSKSQVSREVLCSDLLIFPQNAFVWARLCLGPRVFPGLVRALVKFWTRGPQALTDGNAQDSQGLPFFCLPESRWNMVLGRLSETVEFQQRKIRPRLAPGK